MYPGPFIIPAALNLSVFHGILLRAEWDIARYVRSGRLRLVLEDQTPTRADVYAVYPQQLHLSTRVRSLIDFLVERFKDIDHLESEL